MTAREQEHLGERLEDRLGETEQGDGGGLAGLAAAVEQQARVAGLEHLGLPGVGLQTEAAHDVNAGWSLGTIDHGGLLQSSSRGVEGGYFSRKGASHSSRLGGTASGGTVGGSSWPRSSQ